MANDKDLQRQYKRIERDNLIKHIDNILFEKAKAQFASPQWLIHESNLKQAMDKYFKLMKNSTIVTEKGVIIPPESLSEDRIAAEAYKAGFKTVYTKPITKGQKKVLFSIYNSIQECEKKFMEYFKKPMKEMVQVKEAIDSILMGKY